MKKAAVSANVWRLFFFRDAAVPVGEKVSQTADSCAQAVASELAKTDWTAVSTDANSEDAAYVMAHTDSVALDRLIAFTLTSDGGPSEGA